MFSRPDTGSSPVSYPAPTKSALKSMFETVAFSNQAYFTPQKVEICSPIIYRKYTTNYRGPLRKSGTANFQIFATILENPCYKVYGQIAAYLPPSKGDNPQHMLQEVFMRRLAEGQFFSTPCLGLKEFTASYFGILRDTTYADKSISLIIPSMLDSMYDRSTNGKRSPRFRQDVRIEKGVIYYHD